MVQVSQVLRHQKINLSSKKLKSRFLHLQSMQEPGWPRFYKLYQLLKADFTTKLLVMNDEVKKRWESIPSKVRRNILDNVWCGSCVYAVPIIDYEAVLLESKDIAFKGYCSKCGHNVTRIIEAN